MKLEKIFIVSLFLLAILAMGAVSASEDIADDTISAIEPTDEVISESVDLKPTEQIMTETVEDEPTEELTQKAADEPTEEITTQTADDSEVIGSSDSNEALSSNEGKLVARIGWQSFYESFNEPVVQVDSYGNNDNGTIYVYVNNVKKATYYVYDGRFKGTVSSDYLEFSPKNLGIKSCGNYKIKVTFYNKKTKKETTLNEKKVSILMAKIDESFEYMGENEVLTLYINFPNVKKGTVKLSEMIYDWDEYCYNKVVPLATAKIKNEKASFKIRGQGNTSDRYFLFEYSTDIAKGNRTHYINVEKLIGNYSVSVPAKIIAGNDAVIKFKTAEKGLLTITVDGKVMKYKNVSSKKIKIADLPAGKHIVRVMYRIFASCDDSEWPQFHAIYMKGFVITVKKANSKIIAKKKTFKVKTKTKKFTMTLKTKAGKPIKKVKVTLRVGKKTYKAKTNSKGKATFKITKLKKKGKYTALIKFVGTKSFNASKKKVKITVKK